MRSRASKDGRIDSYFVRQATSQSGKKTQPSSNEAPQVELGDLGAAPPQQTPGLSNEEAGEGAAPPAPAPLTKEEAGEGAAPPPEPFQAYANGNSRESSKRPLPSQGEVNLTAETSKEGGLAQQAEGGGPVTKQQRLNQEPAKPQPTPATKSGAAAKSGAKAGSKSSTEGASGGAASTAALELSALLRQESWREALEGEFGRPYFQQLSAFLEQEWGNQKLKVFPPRNLVFNAFNSCPFDQVKVVILGQDPYHDDGQAMGLSFSVTHGVKKWNQQGVLLLNAVLTVRAHNAGSHSKKGWEQLTDAAIGALSRNRSGVVFLLWGRYAQDKSKLIDSNKHHVLKAAHPSGLSAHRGFFGCRHFSQTNAILHKKGLEKIDWQIDPM
eukprot:gene15688-21795_t